MVAQKPRVFIENINRAITLTPATPPSDASANSGTIRTFISRLMGNFPRVTGKSSWNTAPDINLQQLADLLPLLYSVKQARVATTGSITLSGGQTIDGVAVANGDRVLVKNQGAASGIYTASTTGSWTRVTDMDSSSEVYSGLLVKVEAGTTNGGTLFSISTANPITLGTTSLTFAAVGGGGSVTGHNFWSAAHPDVDTADPPVANDIPKYDGSKWITVPNYTNPTLINGVKAEFLSTTQLTITSGMLHDYSTGLVLQKNSSSTYTPTSPALVANTWYYMYAYSNAGVLTVEHSTTEPVVYLGVAKHKTGDTSRRYIGEFKTEPATTNIIRTVEQNGKVHWSWKGTWFSPQIVQNGGGGTTAIAVNCTGATPAGCKVAEFQIISYGGSNLLIGNPDMGLSDGSGIYQAWYEGQLVGQPDNTGSTSVFQNIVSHYAMSAARQISFKYDGTDGDVFISVVGYFRER